MQYRWGAFALAGALLVPHWASGSEKSEEKIIVVGLDSSGRSQANAIPVPIYRKTLSTAFMAMDQAMAPVLEKRNQAPSETEWTLNSIGIGLGLNAQIGLGPLLNFTLSPQLKLIFTDSKNPVYPD